MGWLVRRRRDEQEELVALLHAERPSADEDFVDALAGHVREQRRFRGAPVRVALAVTSAAAVLAAVALVGGTAQYATAFGAVGDLAAATVKSSPTAKKNDDNGNDSKSEKSKKDSASEEYSEERKQCRKDVKAHEQELKHDADGYTKADKELIKAEKEACKELGEDDDDDDD
jgi:hypothetical protein